MIKRFLIKIIAKFYIFLSFKPVVEKFTLVMERTLIILSFILDWIIQFDSSSLGRAVLNMHLDTTLSSQRSYVRDTVDVWWTSLRCVYMYSAFRAWINFFFAKYRRTNIYIYINLNWSGKSSMWVSTGLKKNCSSLYNKRT